MTEADIASRAVGGGSPKRYPPEVRERAIELVLSAFKSSGERYGHVTRIANQFGIAPRLFANGSAKPRSTEACAAA